MGLSGRAVLRCHDYAGTISHRLRPLLNPWGGRNTRTPLSSSCTRTWEGESDRARARGASALRGNERGPNAQVVAGDFVEIRGPDPHGRAHRVQMRSKPPSCKSCVFNVEIRKRLILLPWHGRGREFESHQVHHLGIKAARKLRPVSAAPGAAGTQPSPGRCEPAGRRRSEPGDSRSCP